MVSPNKGLTVIPWELMKDLAQLSGLIVGWGLFVGCGIGGLTIAIAVICWIIDFVRKELGR
jgi:hypothetical protein